MSQRVRSKGEWREDMKFEIIIDGGESPKEKSSGRGPGEPSPGTIHNSPPILLRMCLDFIVGNLLAPDFQRYLDKANVEFNIEEYYNEDSK